MIAPTRPPIEHVLVTGGAGYVGSALVPALLREGYRVTVLDLYLYGRDLFDDVRTPDLVEIEGDIRDPEAVARAMQGVDAVIHLACISNDPSYDLDPALGRSINYDAFRPLVQAAKQARIPALYFTNLISARPLMGPAGAGSLATVINAAIANRARFERMSEFFGPVGQGDAAGVWEQVPQPQTAFRADTRRQLQKLARKRKAEEMI